MINYHISYGLSNLHICTDDNSIPIPLPGAIEIELNIDDEYKEGYIGGIEAVRFYANNIVTGRLVLVGLSDENKEVLFGITRDSRGGIKSSNNNAPHLHLLLQQELINGSKNLTHIYDVQFKENKLASKTTTEDVEINEIELEFTCYYSNKYESYFYTINTATCLDDSCERFFNELVYPIN